MSPTSYRAAPPRTPILASAETGVKHPMRYASVFALPSISGSCRIRPGKRGNCVEARPGCASIVARGAYFTSVPASSFSPSTEMRSERKKCRSFGVKVPDSAPASAVSSPASPFFSLRRHHFVQADRRLQHQQHVETVLADVLHHARNLFALDDRLMDGLAQLLNQFAQTGCHGYLQERRPTPDSMQVAAWNPSTLLPIPLESNSGIAAMALSATSRCYHHNCYETSHHWPRPGYWSARRWARGRPSPDGPHATRGRRSSPSSYASCRVSGPRSHGP